MFGLIKENILSELEKVYQEKGDNDFKKSYFIRKNNDNIVRNVGINEYNKYDLNYLNTLFIEIKNMLLVIS